MEQTPNHGAIHLKLLAIDLLAQGFTERQVFSGSGIRPEALEDDKPVLAFGKIAAFYENAAALVDDDLLGFRNGWNYDPRVSGLISYVGLASPTVRDYLKNIVRYRRVFSDAIVVNLDKLDEDGSVEWYFKVPASMKRRQYVESTASDLVWSLRHCTRRNVQPIQVMFSHSRKSNKDEIVHFFGCETAFNASKNMVRFKLLDLDIPLLTEDNELYKILTKHCNDILLAKSKEVSNLVVKVERAIVEKLTSGEATQVRVARELGMSARSLSRRLAGEGTTFSKTLESLRLSLASNYLKDSDVGLSQIAFLLGYSDLSTFVMAFKRWTGRSPGNFRAQTNS